MIDNTERALALACAEHEATVADYTVAPVFLDGATKGRHQWLVEFDSEPGNCMAFTESLDANLRAVNSDYDAKRSYDLALELIDLNIVPKGTFNKWLAGKNKLGGQNKVPRLSNDRRYMDEIMEMLKHSEWKDSKS